MAWALSGTGSVTAASTKTSSDSFTTGAITASAGETIVLGFAVDNTLLGPNISSLTKPGSETASWVRAGNHAHGSALGGNALNGEVWVITTTVAWSAFQPVATLDAVVAAKCSHGRVFTGGSSTVRGSTPILGAYTSNGTASKTLTGSEQPQNTDLVIGMGTKESATPPTADTDTTNGSWNAGVTANTTGGGNDATQVSLLLQHKIVTATGDQTYDPGLAGDCGVVAFAIQAGVAPNQGSASGTFAADGTATSSRESAGSGSGTFAADGAATAIRESLGAVNVPVAFDGTATGVFPAEGSASGTFTETATVTDYGNPWTHAVQQTSPYLWWRFADSVGSTTAVDSSGNGRTGTASGVVFGQTSIVPRDPEGNNAVLLDNTGDSILNNSVSFSSTNFTAMVVMKSTSPGGGIFVTGGTNALAFTLTNVFVTINSTGTALTPDYPRANLFDGQAHMIALKVTSTTAELWVDGSMVASATHALSSVTRTQFSLEGTGPIATYDELLLWNSPLTSTQIQDLAIGGGFPIMEGSASGTFSEAGASTGGRASEGSVTGTFSFGGEAHEAGEGDASGTFAYDGSSTGSTDHQGSSSSAFEFVGSGTGSATAEGSASGTASFAGSATGEAPAGSAEGSASGVFAFAGSSTGSFPAEGTASTTFTEAGTSSGARDSAASVTGAFTEAGTVTGETAYQGAAAGNYVEAGSTTGAADYQGQATGADSWAGSSVGERIAAGASSGSFEASATATGSRSSDGSAAATTEWSASSSGERTSQGAISSDTTWITTAIGSSSQGGYTQGAFAADGSTIGEADYQGYITATFTETGSSTGSAGYQGSTTGTGSWAGTATGASGVGGSAAGAFVEAGTAAGQAALRGTGSSSTSWVGTATGEQVNAGSADRPVFWVGVAYGQTTRAGSTAASYTLTGTATGEMPGTIDLKISAIKAPYSGTSVRLERIGIRTFAPVSDTTRVRVVRVYTRTGAPRIFTVVSQPRADIQASV